MLYFLNILANLSEDAKALKYVTPFGYTDSAYIVSNTAIAVKYLLPGIAIGLVAVGVAFWKYTKKDIT
jgi:ABC-2 type transport system permease protein